MLSDEWLPRYRRLKNFTMKWNGNGNGNAHGNGNGNAYDRGDYNSSFALRAVELKSEKNNLRTISKPHAHLQRLPKHMYSLKKNWHKTVGGVAHTRYLLL